MLPPGGTSRIRIGVEFMPKEKKINKKLAAAIATTALLFSIYAFAGNVGAPSSLQSATAVIVTGATNNNNGGENKDRETLSISAVDANGPVADAKCILTNAKGDWSITAPDNVDVRRSDSDLQIKCEKPGYAAAVTTIKATKTQIPRPQFHFAAGGDDDDQDAMITVPQYSAAITVTFDAKQANAN